MNDFNSEVDPIRCARTPDTQADGLVDPRQCSECYGTGYHLGYRSNGDCRTCEREGFESEIASLRQRVVALTEALGWYAEQAADCNRFGNDGDNARTRLAQDRGERARTALSSMGDS